MSDDKHDIMKFNKNYHMHTVPYKVISNFECTTNKYIDETGFSKKNEHIPDLFLICSILVILNLDKHLTISQLNMLFFNRNYLFFSIKYF